MTAAAWDTPKPPASSALFLRTARVVALASLIVGPVAVLRAEPPNVPRAEVIGRDTRFTVAARRELAQDPELAPLNIGVSVRQGMATLWGAVPTTDLAQRAVTRVRRVPGLAAVRNELSIVPRDFDVPVLTRTEPLAIEPSDRARLQPAAGALAARPTEHVPPAAQPSSTSSVPVASPPPLSTEVGLGTPIARPNPVQQPLAVLLPPVALPAGAPPPAAAGVARTESPGDLAGAIDRVRRSDERFRRVQPEVRGGVVILRGSVRRGEDLMALAQALARVSGVERVVLQQVRVEP